MATRIDLKRGSLGDVYRETVDGTVLVVRDLGPSRWRWLARRLAHREAAALRRLAGTAGIPSLIGLERNRLIRSFLPGAPMHVEQPRSRAYFRDALRLVRRLHRHGVTHNDLAKEANWICIGNDSAGIVDFQLAVCFRRRSRAFRRMAREDLRHLLKHKHHYRPDLITARERAMLATPLWPARVWRGLVKPCYLFLTRRVLGWPERDGAVERQRSR